MCTSCYPEYSHDPDDGRIYWQGAFHFQLLQGDAHDGQRHYSYIQLIPPERVSFIISVGYKRKEREETKFNAYSTNTRG